MEFFGVARKKRKDGSVRVQTRSWCKPCASEYQKTWIKKNPEKLAHYQAQDRARHMDRYQEQAKRQRSIHGHPEYKRKALLAGVPSQEISKGAVLRRSGGLCGICEEEVDPFNFHVDHVVPLSKGGHNMYYNVQAAHPRCNLVKNNKLSDEPVSSAYEGCE